MLSLREQQNHIAEKHFQDSPCGHSRFFFGEEDLLTSIQECLNDSVCEFASYDELGNLDPTRLTFYFLNSAKTRVGCSRDNQICYSAKLICKINCAFGNQINLRVITFYPVTKYFTWGTGNQRPNKQHYNQKYPKEHNKEQCFSHLWCNF